MPDQVLTIGLVTRLLYTNGLSNKNGDLTSYGTNPHAYRSKSRVDSMDIEELCRDGEANMDGLTIQIRHPGPSDGE